VAAQPATAAGLYSVVQHSIYQFNLFGTITRTKETETVPSWDSGFAGNSKVSEEY